MNLRTAFLFLIVCQLAEPTASGQAMQDSVPFLNYDTLVARISANQVPYKTFSARAKMTLSDDNSEQHFMANIRMAKDSVVWISLTGAFGVEGGRVLITPDTFRSVNKMAGEYSVRDFNYVQSWLMFPVSFGMVQQMIAGEKINIQAQAAMATMEDSTIVLISETNKLQEKVWVNSRNYTIQKILLKDKLLTQNMTITFGEYNNTEGNLFSYQRHIEVQREGMTLKLDMNITKPRWNEDLTYPYEISEKYKRTE